MIAYEYLDLGWNVHEIRGHDVAFLSVVVNVYSQVVRVKSRI